MLLRSLAVQRFRNLEAASLEFHPAANLFVGDNGQGKTNFLEAIYFLATTKSFRTTHPATLFRFDAETMFVSGVVERNGLERTLSIGLQAGIPERRELAVNGQKSTLRNYVSQCPVIAYSANRLDILRGGPEERRKFLDRGITALDDAHVVALSRYTKILKNRNAVLNAMAENRAKDSTLDPWDFELVAAAGEIVRARRQYLASLETHFRQIVERIGYHVTGIGMRYEPAELFAVEGTTEEENVRMLRRLRPREVRFGASLAGPHRDRISFELDGRDAAEVLSSGELKMIVLFLKLAKIELIRVERGESPLFVFDDVDAELDLPIIEKLLRSVAPAQLFASSAKASIFRTLELREHRLFSIAHGSVKTVEETGL